MNCVRCARPLVGDEVALSRKLLGRAREECMCLTCLAAYYGVTEARLHEKIAEFRRWGCALFAPLPPDRTDE